MMRQKLMFWVALNSYIESIVSGVAPLSLPRAKNKPLKQFTAFGGTQQRNLPEGYTQRNFVYMMDGSYLLTDLVPTYDCKVEMDFATTSLIAGGAYFLGGRTETYGGILLAKGSNGWFLVDAFGNASGDRYTSSVAPTVNTRYKFTFNNKVSTLESGGSVLFTNTSTGENANGAALCINGLNASGTPSGGQVGIYLYSFKMWNPQGQLVANYVPCAKTNPLTVGLYDLVTDTFINAPTAGTWAAGPAAGASVTPTPDAPIDIVCNNGVLKVSPNLIDPTTVPNLNRYIHSGSGYEMTPGSGNFRSTTEHILIEPNTEYYFGAKYGTSSSAGLAWYDDTKTYISGLSLTAIGAAQGVITSPSTAKYVRFSWRIDTGYNPDWENTVYFCKNGALDSFMPYGQIYTDGTVETIAIKHVTEDIASANIDASGTIVSSSPSFFTHTAPVEPGKTYIVDQVSTYAFYTSLPTIGSVSYNGSRITTSNTTITVPNDNSIKYLAFRNNNATSSVYEENNTAVAEMLLKFGAYTDQQEIIGGTVTRNVKALVLDGTESWAASQTYSNVYTASIAVGKPSGGIAPICNCYAGYASYVNMTANDYGILSASTATISIKNKDCADVTAFKTWLADQYAAGTPVIVVYPLGTPTTETVTGQQLSTVAGDNTAEITQASMSGLELEVTYYKQA